MRTERDQEGFPRLESRSLGMTSNDQQGTRGKKRSATKDLEYDFNMSGERQRLNEIMYRRLNESGWMNKVRTLCEEYVAKKGSERVTLEELIDEVRDPARRIVPDDVKRELMEHIRKFVADNTS